MRQPAVCEMQRIRKRGSLVPERGNRFFGRIPIDDPMIRARRPYPEHGLLDGLWSCHHVPRFTVKKCTPALQEALPPGGRRACACVAICRH